MLNIDDYSPIKQADIDFGDDSMRGRKYHFDFEGEGFILPSVTTVMGILDKPALVPWAFNTGVEGAWDALREAQDGGVQFLDVNELKNYLRAEKKSADDKKNEGGSRGLAVHDALERHIAGESVYVDNLEPDHRPYWQQVLTFIDDYDPEFLLSEVKVVHPFLGFAGRLDFVAQIRKHPPRRRHKSLVGKKVLLDLKTNKAGKVYPNIHLPQVEAYGAALHWMTNREITVDEKLVVAVGIKSYQPSVSYAKLEDFTSILSAYNALESLKARNPNGRK